MQLQQGHTISENAALKHQSPSEVPECGRRCHEFPRYAHGHVVSALADGFCCELHCFTHAETWQHMAEAVAAAVGMWTSAGGWRLWSLGRRLGGSGSGGAAGLGRSSWGASRLSMGWGQQSAAVCSAPERGAAREGAGCCKRGPSGRQKSSARKQQEHGSCGAPGAVKQVALQVEQHAAQVIGRQSRRQCTQLVRCQRARPPPPLQPTRAACRGAAAGQACRRWGRRAPARLQHPWEAASCRRCRRRCCRRCRRRWAARWSASGAAAGRSVGALAARAGGCT